MAEAYVLDAWAVMAFLQKKQPAATRVRALLLEAQNGTARLFISLINLGEVYYSIGKGQGQKTADETLAQLRLLPIEILPADNESVLAAARLKMKYALSYADAFAAQCAQQLGAVLVTGDPELIALKSKVKLEKLRRD